MLLCYLLCLVYAAHAEIILTHCYHFLVYLILLSNYVDLTEFKLLTFITSSEVTIALFEKKHIKEKISK